MGSVVKILAEFMGPPAFVLLAILWVARASGPVITGVAIGYAVLFAPVVVRASLLGVYASEYGLRVRRMLGTETVAWADVKGVGDGPAMLGPIDLDRVMIVVTATGGRELRSPVQVGSIQFRRTWSPVNFRMRIPVAAGQLLVAQALHDGIARILRDRLAREKPGAATEPAAVPAPRAPAADAAVIARKRARGE